MEDVRPWIEVETYSVDETAARFHHRLVAIQPFPNGPADSAALRRTTSYTLLAANGSAGALDWT